MAKVSDWSANELENLFLDEMNLSDERGRRAAKIMAAIKANDEDVVHKDEDETINGGKTFTSNIVIEKNEAVIEGKNCGALKIVTSENADPGASLFLAPDSAAAGSGAGAFILETEKGSYSARLIGQVRGNGASANLKWEGGEISSGSDNSFLRINGGADYQGGGFLLLFGKSSSEAGSFSLCALDGVNAGKILHGDSEGNLTWDGATVQTTSDENLKTNISDFPDAVLDAWENVDWVRFKYKDAVATKGDTSRWHAGLVAQRAKKSCESAGEDILKYGILCFEQRRTADENGAIIGKDPLWMVRYEEAFAMEAACQRRRIERLESRIAALEARLSDNR